MIEEKEIFFQKLKEIFSEIPLQSPGYSHRKNAWDHFVKMGLPDRKQEAFQYVPLKKLYEENFSPNSKVEAPKGCSVKKEGISLVFVNGIFRKELSSLQDLPSSILVLSLEEAMRKFPAFLQSRLHKQIEEEQDPFALLNTALHTGGVFVYVPPHVVCKEPLQIFHCVETQESIWVSPRVHVFVGALSEITLHTEVLGNTSSLVNGLLDVAVEEGAVCTLTDFSSPSWYLSATRVTAKRDSKVKSISLTKGGKTVRHSYHVSLLGENAEASLKGLQLLQENKQAHSHVLMQHEAPHCTSMQLFKSVLEDVSQASFEGKILVKQKAQKTQAYQLNNNLLLGQYALCNSKPNLEIFADDVKASHGSTVGRLSEEELFYLQARGIPQEEATSLLLLGFCQEVMQEIPSYLAKDTASFLPASLSKKDLCLM